MFPSLLTTDKDPSEQEEEDQKRSLQVTLTMLLWERRGVDLEYIMSYKAICDNCNGNGHINITNNKGVTEAKQCWMCNSEGEIKYEKDFINKLIPM